MSNPNTLFLLYKQGLKLIDKTGVCESGIWQLSEEDRSMEFLSLHRSKSDRAYKGGKILDIRDATSEEVKQHYRLLDKAVPASAKAANKLHIIKFQMDREWNILWPEEARKNPMAHKGTAHVAFEIETE